MHNNLSLKIGGKTVSDVLEYYVEHKKFPDSFLEKLNVYMKNEVKIDLDSVFYLCDNRSDEHFVFLKKRNLDTNFLNDIIKIIDPILYANVVFMICPSDFAGKLNSIRDEFLSSFYAYTKELYELYFREKLSNEGFVILDENESVYLIDCNNESNSQLSIHFGVLVLASQKKQ